MSAQYRIEPVGNRFTVIGPFGEKVGTYATEAAAERAKKEHAMYETAKRLVNTAVKAHMKIHGVDMETASSWIKSASRTLK